MPQSTPRRPGATCSSPRRSSPSFNLLLLFTFKDVPSRRLENGVRAAGAAADVAQRARTTAAGLAAIMSCFWLMMYQLWDLQPNFIADWMDSGAAGGRVELAAGRGLSGAGRANAARADDPAAGSAQPQCVVHHPGRDPRRVAHPPDAHPVGDADSACCWPRWASWSPAGRPTPRSWCWAFSSSRWAK